ncbi:hypothetical protein L0657_06770 [Dyadobacter sp. CY345]|uniref:hypothetical protein n=1 Tax=Dyadobacter sp. CY345 TaxID=2909335 RepID=UPI001F1A0FC2|nr:hypothetical protein [Dyadobacter sp. CY345]MCF2443653.1 hypothetical protein [Dyadobacter sp. CY345]
MATARVQEAVLSNEVNLFVNKGTTASPNFVMVGCATSKDYGLAINTITLNCDNGKIKIAPEEPDFDLQLTGFVFQYATANVAANVSAREFEEWASEFPQAPREYKLAGRHTGDLVREFEAVIASFRETGSNGEARTYSVSFQISGTPELSDQA